MTSKCGAPQRPNMNAIRDLGTSFSFPMKIASPDIISTMAASCVPPNNSQGFYALRDSVLASDTLQRYCNIISENCNVFFNLK